MELCQTLQQTHNIDCNVTAETLANVFKQEINQMRMQDHDNIK